MSSLEEKKEEPTEGEQITDQKPTDEADETEKKKEEGADEAKPVNVYAHEDEENSEESQDIIDQLPEHKDEETLLEKLGLGKKSDTPYEQMDAQQKIDFDQNKKELGENQAKADKIIGEAKEKLEVIRKATDAAIKQVEELKKANVDKTNEIETEKKREAHIDHKFKRKIDSMRQSRIGEIYWTIKESKEEENGDQSDEFDRLIHNLLMCLYLEDFKIEDLEKMDVKERTDQIFQHYVKEFDRFTLHARNSQNPPKEFLKVFPKPEPKREEEENFEEMYGIYEKWVEDEFNNDEEDEDGGILESTTGDQDFSSVGASVNDQSVATVADKAKAMNNIEAIHDDESD